MPITHPPPHNPPLHTHTHLEDRLVHGRERAGAGADALGLDRARVALAQNAAVRHQHHVRAAVVFVFFERVLVGRVGGMELVGFERRIL